jgi:hypothetical protein
MDNELRQHLLYLLRGGGAHASFDDLVTGFPIDSCGRRIDGLHTLVASARTHASGEWDILEFSRNADHVSPEFPKGYWPKPDQLGTGTLAGDH